MPRKPPTQPWPAATSYARRFQIARRAATQHRALLLAHPNVIAIGVGLEFEGDRARGAHTLRPKRASRHPTRGLIPCVHVVVSAKWPHARRARPGELPDSVPVAATVAGRKMHIAVPVDVVELPPTALHQWDVTTLRGERWAKGTGTCFVRLGKDREQYLLSCHHVLAMTESGAPPAAQDFASYAVSWQDDAFGALAELPRDCDTADAALARNTGPPRSQLGFWDGSKITSICGPYPANQQPPDIYYALTRNSGAFRVQYMNHVDHSEDYYAEQRPVTFHDCIWGVALDGARFDKGDSGAALVDDRGRLIGIHFAGNPSGGRDSFALRAEVVLSAFRAALTLW